MKIYLGSRYSRRDELVGYKAQLEADGHSVTSRWLSGEFGDLVGKTSSNERDPEAGLAAHHDVLDLAEAEVCMIFTDPLGSGGPNGRGGFHVEFGIALYRAILGEDDGVELILVGSRINSFHHHRRVHFARTWFEARQLLVNIEMGSMGSDA